ncbi:MAG TPA: DUF1622 domain-containing protein [Rubrobacter sp.]|nr:DUF1622 domain-containing protein [Rubrobacter sp.]
MGVYYAAVDFLRMFALGVGSFVIFVGIARGVWLARGVGGRARVARQIGEHAALGLDLFIGATLLNLAINPTWTAIATTAITVVVRKLLTYSLNLQRREAGPSTGS